MVGWLVHVDDDDDDDATTTYGLVTIGHGIVMIMIIYYIGIVHHEKR
jgi:hypothetical protein